MYKLFFATMTAAAAVGVLAAQWGHHPIAPVGNEAEAKAILDDAIKAHGGEVALGKIVGMCIKLKGRGYDGKLQASISSEQYIQGFDKIRAASINEDAHFVQIEVINDKVGWSKFGPLPVEKLQGERLEIFREAEYPGWATNLIPLKQSGYRLSSHGEIDVRGMPAVGIIVFHDKHNPLKMYFDKASHLLVEYQRKFTDPESGREMREKMVFSDFRDVQGTKQPFKAESFLDGEKVFDFVVTDVTLFDKPFDEKVFARP